MTSNVDAAMSSTPGADGPHIPSPEVYQSDSPSPPRSPSRHVRNFSKSHDPLLRNLSPTSTLRAFTGSASATAGKSEDQLVRSIESAAPAERAFGVRIAQTCKDIRTWYDEVLTWTWPGTFEGPPEAKRIERRRQMLDDHFGQSASASFAVPAEAEQDSDEVQFWGCLPYEIVVSCEKRVEDIRDALEERDVEDLKNHVLNAHVQPKTAHSAYDTAVQTDSMTSSLQRLDDFTALITATILQALPFLSRLNQMLNAWSVRLVVLRKVPAFLRELQIVQQEIEDSWSAMGRDIRSHQVDNDLLRTNFESLHRRLGKRVAKLGSRLDSVLDDLEGREEVLPDPWIDSFESLEAAYGEWVMQTEREVMTRDLNLSQKQPNAASASSIKSQANEEPTAIGLGLIANGDVDLASSLTGEGTEPAPQAESPILGNGNLAAFGGATDGEVTDSEPEPSPLPPPAHSRTQSSKRRSIPSLPEVDLSRSSSIQRDKPLNSSPARPPTRSRHVPIVVDYEEKQTVPQPAPGANEVISSPTPSELPTQAPGINAVRARAAFLNRGLEQTQTLQKSVNSPVRPFEHASQAFTKLFARANAAQHSRSSSASSRSSSVRKGMGVNNKKDPERPMDRSATSLPSLPPPREDAQLPYPPGAVELAADPAPGSQSLDRDNHNDTSSSAVELPARSAYVTPETHHGFEPSTTESRSTIESAWTSPALSDFPENWPLPLRLNGEEISSPKKAMDANIFEKMFVDSMPASPDESQFESTAGGPLGAAFTDDPTRPRSQDQALHDALLVPGDNVSESSTQASGAKPLHISIAADGGLPTDLEPLAEVSTPASLQSGLSTPEIYSASAAGYFKSKEVLTPPLEERRASASTAKHARGKSSVSSQGESDTQRHSTSDSQPVAKRASVTSVDSYSKSAIKTVKIPETSRRPSSSSIRSPPSPAGLTPSSELTRSPEQNRQASSSGSPPQAARGVTDKNMSPKSFAVSRLPMNLTMPKRRNLAEAPLVASSYSDDEDCSPKVTPVKKRQHRPQDVSGAEQLDRHVSRVLSSLPNRIRFTPAGMGTSADTQTNHDPTKGSLRSRPQLLTKASRTNLTLSPAQLDERSKKSSRSSDPEVKLYHLSQEGKEQPIKLYVRLVGEGERVMVRVGGGWADLGEYLRQYAEHHGHRTVSDGRLEVAGGSSVKVGAGLKVRTPLSRPGSALDRPTSRLSQRRSSMAISQSYDGRFDSPASFGNRDAATTPTPPSTADASLGTPTSMLSKAGSRPSTADAALSSSPASWDGADIGLAGPASKRKAKELDDHKARWVEDMIGRAKQASVEKKNKDDRTWGDIGKIGGTRRVVFKNNQAPREGRE